jgi:hypothetical protein
MMLRDFDLRRRPGGAGESEQRLARPPANDRSRDHRLNVTVRFRERGAETRFRAVQVYNGDSRASCVADREAEPENGTLRRGELK